MAWHRPAPGCIVAPHLIPLLPAAPRYSPGRCFPLYVVTGVRDLIDLPLCRLAFLLIVFLVLFGTRHGQQEARYDFCMVRVCFQRSSKRPIWLFISELPPAPFIPVQPSHEVPLRFPSRACSPHSNCVRRTACASLGQFPRLQGLSSPSTTYLRGLRTVARGCSGHCPLRSGDHS